MNASKIGATPQLCPSCGVQGTQQTVPLHEEDPVSNKGRSRVARTLIGQVQCGVAISGDHFVCH